MSIFFNYIFRLAAGALLLILCSLGGIVWIALALKQLNVVTSQGQDAWLLIKMTTLALPNLLAVIAPFAFLIAAMHSLNRLNTDSELIVLTASGATWWTIAKPLIALALIVTMAVAFVNHVGMPWSLRMLRSYIIQVRTDLLTQVIQPGRFSTPERGLTFHIRERTPKGDLIGLVLNDTRRPKESQAYLAERGQIVKHDGNAYLVMTNGHILRRPAGDAPADVIVFDRYLVDLDQFEKKTSPNIDYKPRERYLPELISPKPDSALFKAHTGQFRAELHERFSNPLYPLAFVLIALASVGQAQSTRQSRNERLVFGFVAATGCRLGGLALNNLVVLNPFYVPLMYLLPISAMVLSFIVIQRNAWPRSKRSYLARLHDSLIDWIITLFYKRKSAITQHHPDQTREPGTMR